jgi:hypothetical protein
MLPRSDLADPSPSSRQGKARFFDQRQIDQGCAAHVVRRAPSLGGLTVLDVGEPEASLASFLLSLDSAALRVEFTEGGSAFRFLWASAYQNGTSIKIQGVLAA